MRKEDIQVGARYTNLFSPNYIYLGIGKRVMWKGTFNNDDSEFTDKNLIVICGTTTQLGQIVQNPEDCEDGFWDSFVRIS